MSSCGRSWSFPFLLLFCLLIVFTYGCCIYWWVLFRIYQSSTMLLRWRSSAVRYMSHWVIGRSIFNDGVCLFYCLRFERRSCLGWGELSLPRASFLFTHLFVSGVLGGSFLRGCRGTGRLPHRPLPLPAVIGSTFGWLGIRVWLTLPLCVTCVIILPFLVFDVLSLASLRGSFFS